MPPRQGSVEEFLQDNAYLKVLPVYFVGHPESSVYSFYHRKWELHHGEMVKNVNSGRTIFLKKYLFLEGVKKVYGSPQKAIYPVTRQD
jgi:hypothetical protein